MRLYQSDWVKDIDEKDFAIILSNPPYHADFSVPKEFIEKGFNRLVICGKMYFYSIQVLM
ncbi:methyltransferase [Clostridium sp. 19966]|uniref:methyltransferase n=1 Tax=Clostridium sp. 19966 TaxID=2768166 RepID=UPI0028DD8E36|nr:methyltransferase [Clostridium sp. 19966]